MVDSFGANTQTEQKRNSKDTNIFVTCRLHSYFIQIIPSLGEFLENYKPIYTVGVFKQRCCIGEVDNT